MEKNGNIMKHLVKLTLSFVVMSFAGNPDR